MYCDQNYVSEKYQDDGLQISSLELHLYSYRILKTSYQLTIQDSNKGHEWRLKIVLKHYKVQYWNTFDREKNYKYKKCALVIKHQHTDKPKNTSYIQM